VVVRPEALRERLKRLEEVISRLEELEAAGPRAGGDFRSGWAIERGLQLAAEILFDVGNHILSAHYGVSPTDYEDILEQLGAHGVIGAALRERLRGLGGFRNVLVHGYLRVDLERVEEALRRAPSDFSAFARAVRGWMERTLA
jgi:uncharacterized protein YutE (UPF0331/DUF86 family)